MMLIIHEMTSMQMLVHILLDLTFVLSVLFANMEHHSARALKMQH